jgi:hypothetical protein
MDLEIFYGYLLERFVDLDSTKIFYCKGDGAQIYIRISCRNMEYWGICCYNDRFGMAHVMAC